MKPPPPSYPKVGQGGKRRHRRPDPRQCECMIEERGGDNTEEKENQCDL